jgi:hypothetical protein
MDCKADQDCFVLVAPDKTTFVDSNRIAYDARSQPDARHQIPIGDNPESYIASSASLKPAGVLAGFSLPNFFVSPP